MLRKRVAILIANSKFESTDIANLSAPAADVEGLEKLLVSTEYGRCDQIFKFIDLEASELSIQLGEALETIEFGSSLLFYYSGHGIVDSPSGELYFACKGTKTSDIMLPTTALPARLVASQLARSRSNSQIVVLDCCHAGAFRDGVKAVLGSSANTEKYFLNSGRGQVVLAATNQIGHALEGAAVDPQLTNSVFTNLLLEGVRTGEADQQEKGFVTAQDAFRYIESKIGGLSPQKPRKWEVDTSGDFIFSWVPELAHADKSPAVKNDHATLKQSVQEKLFPVLEELGRNSGISRLSKRIDDIAINEASPVVARTALFGGTGIGKSTLINAIADMPIAGASSGGVQSASPLVLKAGKGRFRVGIQYKSLEDLAEMTEIAITDGNSVDLTLRPDEETDNFAMAESLKGLFENEALPKDTKSFPSPLKQEYIDALGRGKEDAYFEPDAVDELKELVRKHTNASGGLWMVTEQVTIEGPFEGLPDGTEVIDLPGIGDLNSIRSETTSKAVRDAAQLIVVVGERGITSDVRDLLNDSKVISHLMTAPDIPRILFVGAKLDAADPSEAELQELGLDDDQLDELMDHRFRAWVLEVKAQWNQMINSWAKKTLGGSKAKSNAEAITRHTVYLPTSSQAYMCIRGFERDIYRKYALLYGDASQDEALRRTNVPAVRKAIETMYEDGVKAKKDKSQKLVLSLLDGAINQCELAEKQLKKSQNENASFAKRVVGRQRRASKAVTLIARHKVSLKKEDLKELEAQITNFFKKAWSRLNKSDLLKFYRQEYGDVHYQTFMAALRRQGIYKSKGSRGLRINIPNQVGVYAAEPTASFLITKVLPSLVESLHQQSQEHIKVFAKEVRDDFGFLEDVDERFEREFKGQLIEIVRDAKEELDREFAKRLDDKIVRPFSNRLIDKIYEAMGQAMDGILLSARAKASGKYALDTALVEVADLTVKMKNALIKDSAKFISEAVDGVYLEMATEGFEFAAEEAANIFEGIHDYASTKKLAISKERTIELHGDLGAVRNLLENAKTKQLVE